MFAYIVYVFLFFISEFDIRFNPDVFSPGVKHPDIEVNTNLSESDIYNLA